MQSLLKSKLSQAGAAAKAAAAAVERAADAALALRCVKDNELGPQCASAGPGLLWKVYTARPRKRKDAGPVAVWMLDKKALADERRLQKAELEAVLERMRKDVAQLVKLKHPGVLRVLEPLEENRTHMAFVSEACFASLANLMHRVDNMDEVPPAIESAQLSPLEVKHGVLQIAEALAFLHATARIVHCALAPEAITVTADGQWKLSSLAHATPVGADAGPRFGFPEASGYGDPPCTSPRICSVAPELAEPGGSVAPGADVFSLGLLYYELAIGKPLSSATSLQEYRAAMRAISLALVPPQLQAVLGAMFSSDPYGRPAASQIVGSQFFTADPLLNMLRELGKMLQMTDQQKAMLISHLQSTWQQFDYRVLRFRVLPPILTELRTHVLQPLVLPLVLDMSSGLQEKDFLVAVLPTVQPLLQSADEDLLALAVQHLAKLAAPIKDPAKAQQVVLPIVIRALDSADVRLQEAGARQVSSCASKLSYTTVKEDLLPRLTALVCKTTSAAVRVHSLTALAAATPTLSREDADGVLGILRKVLAADRSSATCMAAVSIADAVSHNFGPEMTAMKVMPLVSPLLAVPALSGEQFSTLANSLRGMISRAEAKRGVSAGSVGNAPAAASTPVKPSPAPAARPPAQRAPQADPFAASVAAPLQPQRADPFAASVAAPPQPQRADPFAVPASTSLGVVPSVQAPPPPRPAPSTGPPSVADQLAAVLGGGGSNDDLFGAYDQPELTLGGGGAGGGAMGGDVFGGMAMPAAPTTVADPFAAMTLQQPTGTQQGTSSFI